MRKYVYQRTCPRDIINNEHHQANSQFIGELLKGDISRVVYNRAHPKDVILVGLYIIELIRRMLWL